ncbi:glycosyltransferase family 2 protein [Candidatus Micrarchaeota archaeon]|nr:glycosyltransferase family 2 protein [Candidatus Micrarchaeota archaeon]
MPINQRWLQEGPELPELVSEIRDERGGKRKKTAIVIPTRNGNDLTDRHLRLLSAQTSRDFDVIMVYGENDGFLPHTYGIPALHLKRNDDYGSAGGFYVGEKFAMENGYEMLILADNDCFPESVSLVKDLLEGIDEGVDAVVPRIRNTNGGKPKHNGLLPQYGCMRARMLTDVGLTYLPFYFGGEDIELLHRIQNRGYRIGYINSVAYHPLSTKLSPFACTLAKMRDYMRGDILCCYLAYPFHKVCFKVFSFTLAGLFLAPFRKELSGIMIESVINGSMMRFFKPDAGVQNGSWPQRYKSATGIEVCRLAYGRNPGETLFGKIRGIASVSMTYLAQIPGAAGKDIIFDRNVGLSGMALAFLARTSWLRGENGGYYPVLQDNRFYLFPLYAAFFLVAFLLAIPITFAFITAGYVKKSILGVKPLGYGTTS